MRQPCPQRGGGAGDSSALPVLASSPCAPSPSGEDGSHQRNVWRRAFLPFDSGGTRGGAIFKGCLGYDSTPSPIRPRTSLRFTSFPGPGVMFRRKTALFQGKSPFFTSAKHPHYLATFQQPISPQGTQSHRYTIPPKITQQKDVHRCGLYNDWVGQSGSGRVPANRFNPRIGGLTS